jgi:hypothetical protein
MADDRASFGRPIRAVAIVGLFAVGLAFLIGNVRDGVGVLCGAALATVNLWAFARVAAAFLDSGGRSVSWAAVSIIKLLALLAIAYALMKRGIAAPLALALGYLALPVGIVLGQLFGPKPQSDLPPSP